MACCINVNAQTARKKQTRATHTTAHTTSQASLQAYRQNFWNNPPQPTGWTNDFDDLFTDEEKSRLDGMISLFQRETTMQICIVTLDTLCTSAKRFDSLALHIANVWGVGMKDKNNGITICISKAYHRVRICNGKGIKQILSDSQTKQILDAHFLPAYKKDQYFQGTWDGVTALIEVLKQG
ncbi:TPM domain-containing protein [Taibaiella soli]|uniref:TPM domain-containing protein n=1 Tax=Taibaiella soli TaxID=1649169 RepID=A0A2W2B026_9BACT|nr:TPM domain-containing protein [Taibaiella soli]PZF73604.1 hypothetical protein DN068_07735 [Taibaiella soli]